MRPENEKNNQGLRIETGVCRLCGVQVDGVLHPVAGCKVLAGCKHITRQNGNGRQANDSMVQEQGLIAKDELWYNVTWDQRAVVENESVKMSWDFGYHMRKETAARRQRRYNNRV